MLLYKCKIILIYRKQYTHTYSIEFIFDQILIGLQVSQNIQKYNLLRYSNSVINRLLNLISILFLPAKIIHVTGDVHYAILGAWFKKRILTIHDLAFMHQNKGVKRSILKWFYIILPVRFAHQITVVSEATRKDLSNYVLINTDKIKVIPNFISEAFHSNPDRNFNTTQPQMLQIGTAFNKNIERLAEAITNLNCKLVIIGNLNEVQVTILQKFKINYITKTGLSEQQLLLEYDQADLLTFVSTMEGFGLPILEAQACGLPVVTSNCSSMPEVAGNAAVLVDPFDVQSVRSGILQVINDCNLREAIVKKGFENVKRFSKENIISQYNQLYQDSSR
ncbi:MAG: glycosyltransferase family 1 protein [Sphingobacteriaceae bacterium]|nr:MAG: glycosyltransferase family 1 protein [Sphingobacteriaceae bacterium]